MGWRSLSRVFPRRSNSMQPWMFPGDIRAEDGMGGPQIRDTLECTLSHDCDGFNLFSTISMGGEISRLEG